MTQNICPYLGSLGDPLSCTTAATEDNLCYATGEGDLITKPYQKKYCLSGKMTSCPQFPAESTLSTFSTATAPLAEGESAARSKPSRSSHRGTRRPVTDRVAEGADEYFEDTLPATEGGFDARHIGKDAGPEDAYFDVLQVGLLGDATPDDFYFDDLEKAAAAAPTERKPIREEPAIPSGNTVLIDLNEVKAKKGHVAPAASTAPGRSSPTPERATPVAAPPVRAQERPTSVEPPVRTSPANTPEAPASTPTVASAAAAPATAAPSTNLYDNTTVIPTVQRPPATGDTARPNLGMPEPAKPTAKPTQPEEKRPRKNYAGADPSWLARQIAEQARPVPNGSMPESPRPVKPAPALVPNPARIRPPVVSTAPAAATQSFPEQLPEVPPKLPQSRTLLYLSLSTGVLAVVLVCVGTLVLRGNLLAGGSNILAAIGATAPAVAMATPAESAAAPLIAPTATASAAETVTGTVPTVAALVTDTGATATAASATDTPAPETTATPEPATQTATATATATAPPPTDTPAPTASPMPSASPTAKPTDTPVPTDTSIPTATPSATATPTSIPSSTATVAPTATESPAPASTLASAQSYVVQGGDTPYDIANRYGITVAELMAANPTTNPRLMRVGQELKIPRAGDTTAPATAAPTATAPADTPTAVPSPSPIPAATYVIKGGDTLMSIAGDLGIDRNALLDANPGLDPRLLHIGQEIKLPSSGAPTPAAVAAATPTAPAAASILPATHVVKSGDTLLAIAIRYDLTTEDLIAINPGLNANRLQIGQEIKLPQAASAPAVNTSDASPTSAPSSVPPAVEASLVPVRIAAPSIKLDAPIVPITPRKDIQAGAIALVWDEPDSAAGFHTDSTPPGQTGNLVLSGANSGKGEVFRNISDLKEGDEIQVFVGDQSYKYQVERVLMMPDKYISAEKRQANDAWLAQTSDSRLTLVSYGPYPTAAQRVVVVARAAATQ